MQRMACVSFISASGRFRPDIVIAGSEEDSIAAIRREHLENFAPFRVHCAIVTALNRIANGYDKIGMVVIDFPPDFPIHTGNGFPSAVAEYDETEAGRLSGVAKENDRRNKRQQDLTEHRARLPLSLPKRSVRVHRSSQYPFRGWRLRSRAGT